MKGRPDIPSCHRCLIPDGILLRYQIASNGRYQYFWYCSRCERGTPGGVFIPHETIKLFNLPDEFYARALFNDNREKVYCDICGANGAEVHHWAPQSLKHIFGDNWKKWPTAKLCVDCHRLWHTAVTPYLPGYNQDPVAVEVMNKYKSKR